MRLSVLNGLFGLALAASLLPQPIAAQTNELPAISAPPPRQNTGAIQPRPQSADPNTSGDVRFSLPARSGAIPATPGSGGVPPNTPRVENPREAAPRPIGPTPPRAPSVAAPTVPPPLMRAPVEPSRIAPLQPRQPAGAPGQPAGDMRQPAGEVRPKFEARQPEFRPQPPGYRAPLSNNRPGIASPPPGRTMPAERPRLGTNPNQQAAPPGFMPVPRPNRPGSPGPVARPTSPIAQPLTQRRGANPPSALGRCTPQMLQQKMC